MATTKQVPDHFDTERRAFWYCFHPNYYLVHNLGGHMNERLRRLDERALTSLAIVILALLLCILAVDAVLGLSQAVFSTFVPLLSASFGGLLSIIYQRVTTPDIILEPPVVTVESDHDMPRNTKHIRVPVKAEGRTIKDVKAKIVGGSEGFQPRGRAELFWAHNFEPHGVLHDDLEDEMDVLSHMGEEHLKSAGRVDDISVEQGPEFVNIAMKVEDIPGTFAACAEGTAPGKYADVETFCDLYDATDDQPEEFANGEFEIQVEVLADGGRSKVTTVRFRTGPNFDQLQLID